MLDIVLLTEARYENPVHPDWYVNNILLEDRLVKEALERRGLRVARKDWATADFNWAQTRYALFRTTWDYFDQFEKFNHWLNQTASLTRFINPVEQIRWNMDKHYLLDLQKAGIAIPETHFISKGSENSLKELHESLGWKDTVLKPTVSGAARHTYRLSDATLEKHEDLFSQLMQKEDFMLQPFQYYIKEKGELSLMVIDGKYTHAVLKVAKKGDFRVQDDFGGTVHDYVPSQKEIDFSERAVAACHPTSVYARVDLFYDNHNQLVVGELELIEPEMWFRKNPEAAELLAEAILPLF